MRTLLIAAAAATLLCSASCSDRPSPVRAILDSADSLMAVLPQSALDTLQSLDSTALSRTGKRDRAAYTLLMTEARYKCWLPVDSDTSIFRAADFFRRKGPEELYARALMMQGAVLQEREDPAAALEAFKKAEPLIAKEGDLEQLGLLHTRIGSLYQMTFVDRGPAINRYRKAVECFEKANAANRLSATYQTLARSLLGYSTQDALEYILEGITIAENENDPFWTANGYELLAWYYIYTDEYKKAVLTATGALYTIKDTPPSAQSQLATAAISGYIQSGEPDSAEILLKYLELNDKADYASYYKIKYEIAALEQNWKVAFAYRDSAANLKQKIIEQGKALDLENLEKHYDTESSKLKAENRSKASAILFLSSALIIMALCLAIILYYLKINKRQKNELKEISKMLLNLSDSLLTSYKGHKRPENFQEDIKQFIDEYFHGENIRPLIERISDILYPGFTEALRKKYPSLTDSDLIIISLNLCELSTKSIAIISGRSESALYTAKTRIAQKTGCGKPFSEFIQAELSSHQTQNNKNSLSGK